jgi:hypothetical protein
MNKYCARGKASHVALRVKFAREWRMEINRLWRHMFCAPLMLSSAAAYARDSLGVYDGWGAFRDAKPHRCYAIAAPDKGAGGNGRWKPFASVAHWPDQGIRGQVHIRLSSGNNHDALVLKIDDRTFPLVAGGADAWAPNAGVDAAIVAAMRSGHVLSVGRNAYTLKGAASAIDAAALGCAKSR